MNFLFIHQNFPGQFKHLSRALAAQGHRVVALTPRVKERTEWNGVTILPYKIEASTGKDTHRWLTDLDTKSNAQIIAGALRASYETLDSRPTRSLPIPDGGKACF